MTRALIIDDSEVNIEVLQRLLLMQNVESTAFLNPRQLDDIRPYAHAADVIFLDLEMPYLSGYDVFRALEDELGGTVPIVAYTVHISEINAARDIGFHSFLGKPIEAARFPDHLAHILRGEPVWER